MNATAVADATGAASPGPRIPALERVTHNTHVLRVREVHHAQRLGAGALVQPRSERLLALLRPDDQLDAKRIDVMPPRPMRDSIVTVLVRGNEASRDRLAAQLVLEQLRRDLHEVFLGDDADQAIVLDHRETADAQPAHRA